MGLSGNTSDALQVLGGGLQDLGGFSGGGHMQYAQENIRKNRQDRAARDLGTAIQSGLDPALAVNSFIAAGGDPSTASQIVQVQSQVQKASAMKALGAYMAGVPGGATPSPPPGLPGGAAGTPPPIPGPPVPGAPMAGPMPGPAGAAPAGALPGGYDPNRIISLLAGADPGAAAQLAFQQRDYEDKKDQQDYQDVTKAQDSVNAALRQSRMDDPRYKGQVAKAEADAKLQDELQIEAAKKEAPGGLLSVLPTRLPDGSAGFTQFFRNGTSQLATQDGKPWISAARDPTALGEQASAREGGTKLGEAAAGFPAVQGAYDMMKRSMAGLEEPAVKAQASSALGLVGQFLPKTPGVNSDFLNRMQQVQGQAFLQAYNTLKGGGSITDVEGAKATAAIIRLQRASTKDEFYSALNDAEREIDALYKLAQDKAKRGAVTQQLQTPGMTAPVVGPGQRVRTWNPQTQRLE